MIVRTTVKSIQDIMRQDVGVDGDAQRISQLCWMFFLKIIDDQDQELELTRDGYHSPIPDKLQWRNWAADPELSHPLVFQTNAKVCVNALF
jgi:type I restriction enzyme M protein